MMLPIVLGLTLVAGAGPGVQADDFEVWYRRAVTGDLDIPRAVERRARGFRYVFIAGYRNESISAYFSQNIAQLKRRGVPADQIEVIRPESIRDDAANAETLDLDLRRIAAKGPEKLVLIGHSRGACDALGFALDHPGFVLARVEALYLIQGPFGGSEAAAHLVGTGTAMDRRMPWPARLIASLAERVVRRSAGSGGSRVVADLVPDRARRRWGDRVAACPEAAAIVGPKTRYITSVTRPARLGPIRRAIGRYVATYHGASDGIIRLDDQAVPGLGTVVATVEAGHADLAYRTFRLRRTRRLREAVADAIVMAVGQAPKPTPGLVVTSQGR